MISFGKKISEVVASEGGGKFKNPPNVKAGYKLKIVGAKVATSTKGNPYIQIDVDIADGEFAGCYKKYPRRYYQNLSNDIGMGIMKKIIDVLIAEPDNSGLISPSVMDSDSFDESVIVGLTVGGVLEPDGKYLNVAYLCSTEYAATVKGVEVAAGTAPVDPF